MEELEQKCWGTTRLVTESQFYSLHELTLLKGGFSSFHFHKKRANRFKVLYGVVRVVWSYGWRISFTDLSPDNVLDLPSLVPHQFQVLESGTMLEEYYSDRGGEIDVSDIERLTVGGMRDWPMDHPGVLLTSGNVWAPDPWITQ